MDSGEARTEPRIRVRHGLGESRRPITLIQVDGEHGYDARALLIATLEPIDGHVVIDLTTCSFVDKYVIGAVIGKALDLGTRGHRLELVVPPAGPLRRTVDLLGLRDVVLVTDEPPPLEHRTC